MVRPRKRGSACTMVAGRCPSVGELLVDVVGEDENVGMPQQHLAQRPQIGDRVGGAGGIAGIIEDEPFCPRCYGRLQILRAQLEAVVLAARNKHRRAVGECYDIGIADPAWRRNNRLIAAVQRGDHGVEDHLLAAGGDDDFLGRVIQPAVAPKFFRDGAAQRQRAGDVGVFGLARLDGPDRGCLHIVRRVEIGLARGHAKNVAPGRLHRGGLGADGDGLAGTDAVQPVGGELHAASF